MGDFMSPHRKGPQTSTSTFSEQSHSDPTCVSYCCIASCRNRDAALSCKESFNNFCNSVSFLPQQRPPFASCLNGLEMSMPWYNLRYTLRSQILLTRSKCFFTSVASTTVMLTYTSLPCLINDCNMSYIPPDPQSVSVGVLFTQMRLLSYCII